MVISQELVFYFILIVCSLNHFIFSREMWDSEQFSQAPGSCSQGSQNSSSDLFSQSKMSQLKGFSSFDVWSQPPNSQQITEV